MAIIAGTLVGIGLFTGDANQGEHEVLHFAFVEDAQARLDLDAALQVLRPEAARYEAISTRRRETPFWLLTESFRRDPEQVRAFEVASRHLAEVDIWLFDEQKLVAVATTDHQKTDLVQLARARAGFSMPIASGSGEVRALVRFRARGPGRISTRSWNEASLTQAEKWYNSGGGMLFGSMLTIAAFGVFVGALTRDWAFFLFAGWVAASLRFASYSGGWDMTWLGYPAIDQHPVISKNIPLAIYAYLMIALFRELFRRELRAIGAERPTLAVIAIGPILLVTAIALPLRYFLPVLWAIAIPSILLMAWLTIRVFLEKRSGVAFWYGASWIVTLGGVSTELAAALGFIATKPTWLNGVSGAVMSALLTGVALVERIKYERAQRHAAQANAVKILGKFKENYNSMPVGLFVADHGGRITLCNPEFSRIFGLPEPTPENVNLGSLLGWGPARAAIRASQDQDTASCEILAEGPGEPRWFLAQLKHSGQGIEGSIQDISARKAAEGKLQRLVTHDPLTGVLNRRGLDTALRRAIADAATGSLGALAYIDLDRFKVVNDLHGHATGDAVLRVVAQRLQESVRLQDAVARIADSFLIVFQNCSDEAVSEISERIRVAISAQPVEANGKALNITTSIGVVQVDPSIPGVDLIATADQACLAAKAQGRNRVVFLNEKDDSLRVHREEMALVAGIRDKTLVERYFLEFQPIVALQNPEASLNYEILIRMRGPDGKTIPPGRFIAAAERNGLISHIDRWVLQNTLEWLDEHPQHRDRLDFATLNFSGASVNDARFVEDAFALIAEHPLAVRKLCFEITESVALQNIDTTRQFIDRLRACGAKLALDDFGAGYTSFSYLREIPADLIKIDGSFVRDIDTNPGNHAITRMIAELTHELGMECIAEWAETAATVQALVDLGVDYGQGFALARPQDKRIVTAARNGLELVRDDDVVTVISPRPALQTAH